MSILRRYDRPGDRVFIACRTILERQVLVRYGDQLRGSFEYVQKMLDVQFEAWVILPDHFHALLALGDVRLAQVVKRIKEKFARVYRSILRIHSGRIWQHRYWDHIIRDQEDWRRHIDYIHFNSVKHGHAHNPFDWPLSSLHEYLEAGMYEQDWRCDKSASGEEEFGE